MQLRIFPFFKVCYPPIINRLIPTAKLQQPKAYGKRRSFYVTASVSFQCVGSRLRHYEWRVYNQTSNRSYLVQFPRSVENRAKQIFIPGGMLGYGLYEFRLTVNILAFQGMNATDSTYVEITQSNNTANLVKFGTSMITNNYDQNLVLDPGHHSVDPDTRKFNATVSDCTLK